MNYKELNDYELVSLAQENNEDASKLLYDKYYPLILQKCSSMYKKLQNKGIELSDLIQECNVGFTEAISSFNERDDVTFYTFVNLCMDRQLATEIKKLNRDKHKILNESVPLEIDDDNDKLSLINFIEDNNDNPELNLVSEEEYKNLFGKIMENLSDVERKVLLLRQDNYSYKEIASILNRSEKSIDNTLYRIRFKVRQILDKS